MVLIFSTLRSSLTTSASKCLPCAVFLEQRICRTFHPAAFVVWGLPLGLELRIRFNPLGEVVSSDEDVFIPAEEVTGSGLRMSTATICMGEPMEIV